VRPRREYAEKEPGRSVVVRRRVTPRFAFDWHHHPEIELTMIVRGHGTRLVGDCYEEYSSGDLVLLGPSLPHTWISDPTSDVSTEAIYAHFNREDLGGWPELAELDPLLKISRRGLAFPAVVEEPRQLLQEAADEPGDLRRLVSLIDALACLAQETGSATAITSAAYEMSTRSPRPSSPEVESRLEIAHSMIADAYPHDLDFGEIADRAGMSEAGFSRFFKRATGRTFTQYVQEVRIAEACRLLGETELSVTYIAHASGFGSLTQFNRVFRRLKNRTPTQWRQAFA